MKKGNLLYIRTDYKVEGKVTTNEDFEDHLEYLENVANRRFFMGGGFTQKPGGMIVFEAKDIKDAEKIAEDDPLIARGLYTYELVEWEMVILSQDLQ